MYVASFSGSPPDERRKSGSEPGISCDVMSHGVGVKVDLMVEATSTFVSFLTYGQHIKMRQEPADRSVNLQKHIFEFKANCLEMAAFQALAICHDCLILLLGFYHQLSLSSFA